MTEETKNAYYVVGALSAAFVLLCVLMSGCGTVTCAQGVKFISAAWSVGSCIFSSVKSNSANVDNATERQTKKTE